MISVYIEDSMRRCVLLGALALFFAASPFLLAVPDNVNCPIHNCSCLWTGRTEYEFGKTLYEFKCLFDHTFLVVESLQQVSEQPRQARYSGLQTGNAHVAASLLPQLQYPPILRPLDPLAAFNEGLDTARKIAQMAEDSKMQRLREQMARLQVDTARRELV